MSHCSIVTVGMLLVGGATASLAAQAPGPLSGPTQNVVTAGGREPTADRLTIAWPTAMRRSTSERLIIGGVVGAVAGLVACTAISNIIEEEGGFHTCTAKGNVLFGLGGAAVGVLAANATR
jgi:hypothetical protein